MITATGFQTGYLYRGSTLLYHDLLDSLVVIVAVLDIQGISVIGI